MSQEEEKGLKELVTQCLATKGFLGKIQAEIRAGVFVALEEQDVLKDIFLNKPLKEFVETTHGALVISLVREFLEFFNLQFTNMVFDPETHAGIDYKFEGRQKLANDLNVACDEDKDVPLLGLLLQSLNLPKNTSRCAVNGFGLSELSVENGDLESEENKNDIFRVDCIDPAIDFNCKEGEIRKDKSDKMELDMKSERNIDNKEESEMGLGNLPPLNGSKAIVGDSTSPKIGMDQLNVLLQYEPDGGDCNYEEDFISSGSEKKDKTDSTESEIEEELPSNSIRSTGDDLTVDMTISKESGQGDYTEKLSNG